MKKHCCKCKVKICPQKYCDKHIIDNRYCKSNHCTGCSFLSFQQPNTTMTPGTVQVFYHGDTNELVFMARPDNGDVKFSRLPLNMG